MNTTLFKRIPTLACAGSLLFLMIGCKAGQNYVRPQLPAPATYRGADEALISSDGENSVGDKQWAEVFREPELRNLIRIALGNNFDMRIAAQRVLEEQAQLRITRSQQFPSVNVGAAGIGADLGSTALSGFPSGAFAAGTVSLSAIWNPDFWGLYSRQTEAQRAQLLGQVWAQRAVRITVVQQTAAAYLHLRSLDEQLSIAKQTLKARLASVELTRMLESRGAVPLSDLRQAEELQYTASVQIPLLEQETQQVENALRLLLGQNPGPIGHTDPNALAPVPRDLPAGIPSRLLERRPDILQAEQQLIAANARIGVARAQFFPQFSITASEGAIFAPASQLGFAIGSLMQPIFQEGRLRGQLQLSEESKKEMLLNYQKTIAAAFRDVSNALIAVDKQRAAREQQEKLVAAAEDAERLARMRYDSGAASYLEVLTTDSFLLSAQLNLVNSREGEAQSLVQLYGALGGGWQQ